MRLRPALAAVPLLSASLAAVPVAAQAPSPSPAAPIATPMPLPTPGGADMTPPRETVTAEVGGKKVALEYGRPSLEGGTLEQVLSHLAADRVWRVGVNQPTTLTTEGSLRVGNRTVPAGTYSVFVYAPEKGHWSLILNRDLGVELGTLFPETPPERAHEIWPRLGPYSQLLDKEVVRAAMKAAPVTAPADRLTLTLAPAGKGAALLTVAWGNRAFAIDLSPGPE